LQTEPAATAYPNFKTNFLGPYVLGMLGLPHFFVIKQHALQHKLFIKNKNFKLTRPESAQKLPFILFYFYTCMNINVASFEFYT